MPSNKDFSLELRAQELGLNPLKVLEKAVQAQFDDAIRQTANAAYASIVAQAKAKLGSLSQEYLKGLDFHKIGKNQYLIVLDGTFSNALERGIAPHDMKETMLASQAKVSEGSRAGMPWVQKAVDGHRYAYVPFPKKPFSKSGNAEAQRINGMIRTLTAKNRQGVMQNITKVFSDSYGRPLEGNVATVGNIGIKDLDNLVKFQKVQKNAKTGRDQVISTYMTFRTISDNSPDGKWQHPGREGLKAFLEAEAFVARELDNILKHFLG